MKTLTLIVVFSYAFSLFGADAVKSKRLPDAPAASTPGGGGMERMLTDEQRKQFREGLQAQMPEFRENMQRLGNLRRELQDAVLNGIADEKLVQEKTDAIGKLEAVQLRARTLALAKIASTLTLEQRERIKKMEERMGAKRLGLSAGPYDNNAPGKKEPAAPSPPEK